MLFELVINVIFINLSCICIPLILLHCHLSGPYWSFICCIFSSHRFSVCCQFLHDLFSISRTNDCLLRALSTYFMQQVPNPCKINTS